MRVHSPISRNHLIRSRLAKPNQRIANDKQLINSLCFFAFFAKMASMEKQIAVKAFTTKVIVSSLMIIRQITAVSAMTTVIASIISCNFFICCSPFFIKIQRFILSHISVLRITNKVFSIIIIPHIYIIFNFLGVLTPLHIFFF